MSLPGLPPLPKSLSGFELKGGAGGTRPPPPDPPRASRTPATLDSQLALLRREMFSLRQLDLSLLSQLWALNESIQEFRQLMQEQEALSPPSPSPTPSASSGDEGDDPSPPSPMRRPAPPPPPARKAPPRNSSAV